MSSKDEQSFEVEIGTVRVRLKGAAVATNPRPHVHRHGLQFMGSVSNHAYIRTLTARRPRAPGEGGLAGYFRR